MIASGIMVDIETLSLRPNAVILSVGAVEFAFSHTIQSEPVILGKHLWVLNVREQLLLGRHVDSETVAWWSKQPKAAREHLYDAERDLQVFASEFQAVVLPYEQVWAQGTDFDIPIINSFYSDLSRQPPWKKYNVGRDVRTIVGMFSQTRFSPDDVLKAFHGKEHDPVVDCEQQIWKLWEHWPS